MKIKKIIMVLKRTQYVTIEVSEAEGYEMPEDANALISMVEDLKEQPMVNTDEADWDSQDPGGVEILSLDIEE